MRSKLLERVTALKAPELATATARAPERSPDAASRHSSPTMLLDCLVALCAVLAEAGCRQRGLGERMALLTMISRARFREDVAPGTQLVVEAHGVALASDAARVRGELRVDDRLVAEAELTFRLVQVPDEQARAKLAAELERLTRGS